MSAERLGYIVLRNGRPKSAVRCRWKHAGRGHRRVVLRPTASPTLFISRHATSRAIKATAERERREVFAFAREDVGAEDRWETFAVIPLASKGDTP